MDVTSKLTVFFEDPFWVGVYERTENGRLYAARVVFGAEPKDYEVYRYFVEKWDRLIFGPSVEADSKPRQKGNPKKSHRDASRELSKPGVGTKAQQALKQLQESRTLERRAFNRQKTQEEKDFQFSLRQQKKREKHKGR